MASARAERTAPAADTVAFWESYEGHPYALPDVVVLDAAEVDAIRAAARDAWSVFVRVAPLLHALPDEGLHALGIPAAACEVVRLRDQRAGETLVARFDFLREGGRYRVLELNAETPFFLVESFVESGRRACAAGLRDPNAGEYARLGDAFAAALAPLAAGARIGVVATNVYREDVGTACALRDLIAARVAAEVVFVPIHELAVVDGEVCDEHGPLDVLYRCYPLEHLAADPDGPALFDAVAGGACRLLNPPSALLLQSKATQALIWGCTNAANCSTRANATRLRGFSCRPISIVRTTVRSTCASPCWAARGWALRSSIRQVPRSRTASSGRPSTTGSRWCSSAMRARRGAGCGGRTARSSTGWS